jgi:hypothetical protein
MLMTDPLRRRDRKLFVAPADKLGEGPGFGRGPRRCSVR